MKQIKVYLSLCFLAIATVASAQFMNAKNSSKSSSGIHDLKGWNRIQVSYNPMTLKSDVKDADDLSFNSFSIGYMRGISLSKSIPLFTEVGANILWTHYGEDQDPFFKKEGMSAYYTNKINMYSIHIPINLAYKLSINKDFSVLPYIGIDLRVNISGKESEKLKLDLSSGSQKYEDELLEDLEDEGFERKIDLDLFDKKDMGSKEATWNRFQIGWHIGAGVVYKSLYASVNYGTDFSEIVKKGKFSTTSITLGYNF